MARWSDGYWVSSDGLRLHYRDYAGGGEPSADPLHSGPDPQRARLRGVAARLAGKWRLICVDLRGRGESAHAKDPMTYMPLTYLQDLEALIAELKLERFVLFGTSLGGLMTMLLAATRQGADRRRPAQRYRAGGGDARARPYPLLCRPLAELADLAPCRPLPRRGAERPLSRLGPRRLAGLRQAVCRLTAGGPDRLRLRHADRRAVQAAAAARPASTSGRPSARWTASRR